MTSYPEQTYYGPPNTNFPPTPNSQADDYPNISLQQTYYDDTTFQPFSYDILPSGPAAGHIPISSIASIPGRAPSPVSRGTRGSSEEKEANMTPSQRRRKEQNRAAQRAFRERKERHVKELELRLANLEQAQSLTTAENTELREQLSKTRLENRLLTETQQLACSGITAPPDVGPMIFTPTDANFPGTFSLTQEYAAIRAEQLEKPPPQFTTPIFGAHPNKGPIHRITKSPKTGEKLLGTGAAWELIICHPLYQQGVVDISDISDRLKKVARCDGQGPVFGEKEILKAIHESSGSGNDELTDCALVNY